MGYKKQYIEAGLSRLAGPAGIRLPIPCLALAELEALLPPEDTDDPETDAGIEAAADRAAALHERG
eukprot:1149099-Pelagomonas_calceolata.AAC.1